MFRKACWLGLLVSAFVVSGCTAAVPEDGSSEDPSGELGEETSFSGGWRFFAWDFSCEASKLVNDVKPKSRRHVYRFWGKSGQVSFELSGSWPKSYGAIAIVMDANGGLVDWGYSDTAHLALDVELEKDGPHWVFVSPAQYQKVSKSWGYVLEAKCASCKTDADCDGGQRCLTPVCITTPCDFPGQCVDQPLCAQYETSDGRFYAKNFPAGEWDAAQTWTTLDPEVMASGVSLGTCLDANAKPCPTTDPPVCGVPVSTDVAATYAGVCEFQKVIREAAGTTGESKGKYTAGACAPVCDYSDPSKTWVAKSPEQCALVKFYCTPPTVPFFDECGCGCVQQTK